MTLGDDIRKVWWKSKTMLFNLILILSGAAAMFEPVFDELEVLGMEPQTIATLRLVLMLVGIIGTVLRGATAGGVRMK